MELGTWGEWVAGIGTVLAVFAAIGIAWWEARRQQARVDDMEQRDRESQARSVHVWVKEFGDGEDPPEYRLLVYNASSRPVFDLEVWLGGVDASAAVFRPDRPLSLGEPVLPGLSEITTELHVFLRWVEQGEQSGEPWEYWGEEVGPVEVEEAHAERWRLSDADGRRWEWDAIGKPPGRLRQLG